MPEVYPETHDVFYEREDEAHVLKVIDYSMCIDVLYKHKSTLVVHYLQPIFCNYLFPQRIAGHTRSGGLSELNLEHYVEAVHDPSSG